MPDPETLAREATGDSVTVERLVGDADGFPNCGPALQSGQKPQHMIPLDPDGALTVGVSYSGTGGMFDPGPQREVADTQTWLMGSEAAMLVTWDELMVLVDQSVFEVPYAAIGAVLYDVNGFEIHGTGARDYLIRAADGADLAEVRAAAGHLRKGVRHHRSDGRQ